MVTVTWLEGCDTFPAASRATTSKVYAVDAPSPATVKEAALVVPTCVLVEPDTRRTR